MKRLALVLSVCLLGITTIAFAACGDDDDGGDLKKVTLMLDWTPNTHHSGFYLAQEKGWYRDAGIDLQIVEPAEGGVEAVVGAGRADFGISIQEAVIPARAAGVPIVSIAAIKQHNDSSLIALKGEGITRPRDLAGKTYGGFGGALETALIKQLVSRDGGDPEKIKFVEVGNIDYLAGMEANQFDFVWVFEGWDAIRYNQVENKPVTSLKFTDYLSTIPDWYTPLIITSESTIKNDPATVRKFLDVTNRGYNEAIKNPDSAATALLKGAPELDEKLVKLSQTYHTTKYMDSGRRWGLQDAAVWVGFEKFLRDAKLIDKEVDVSKAYTNDYLPKP